MKIIGTSNFDDDTVSDILICENIQQGYDKIIISLLNSRSDNQAYFFKVVDNNFKLYKFEP